MKRIKMLLMFIFFFIFIPTVYAEGIDIKNINMVDKANTAKINNEATHQGLSISFDIKFININDYVKYEVVINNDTGKDYEISENIQNNSDFISYEYSYDDNNKILEKNKESKVYVTIKYGNKVPDDLFDNGLFTEKHNIVFELQDEEGNIVTPTDINPQTEDAIIKSVVVLVISSVGLIVLYKTNKKKQYITLFILGLVLIPTSIYAIDKIQITIESDVIIEYRPTMLIPGPEFNAIIREQAEEDPEYLPSYNNSDNSIFEFKRSETPPSEGEETKIVSLPNEPEVISWYDTSTKTIYWYTDATAVYTNYDASYMFANLNKLQVLETNYFDTSKTTNMSNMFRFIGSYNVSVDYSFDNLDTSNVTNMSEMFYHFADNNETIIFDLNNWNISKVTNMNSMFKEMGYNSKNVTIDVHEWDITNVEDMEYMFDGAGWYADKFVLNIDGWDLRNYQIGLTQRSRLLGSVGYSAKDATLYLNNIKVGQYLPSFNQAVYNAKNVKVYMNDWVLDGTTNLSQTFINTFYSMSGYTRYFEIKNWDISNITSTDSMFYQMADGRADSTYIDLSGWKLSKNTPVNRLFYDIFLGSKNSYIDLSNWDLGDLTNLQYMFYYVAEENESATIDITGWDTSKVTDMSHMFHSAAILSDDVNIIGIEDLNTSKVTNMESMFINLIYKGNVNWDLSKWDVSKVTDMSNMFNAIGQHNGDKITSLDLSNWDISGVTNAYAMFSNMTNLRTIYTSGDWEFEGVTDPSNLGYLFAYSYQITGGNGSTYQGVYDVSMAKIDREGVPGFFTLKQ